MEKLHFHIPGTQMTSIFQGQPPPKKNKAFSNQKFQVYIYILYPIYPVIHTILYIISYNCTYNIHTETLLHHSRRVQEASSA